MMVCILPPTPLDSQVSSDTFAPLKLVTLPLQSKSKLLFLTSLKQERKCFSRRFWKTKFQFLLCFPSETQLLSDVALVFNSSTCGVQMNAFKIDTLSTNEWIREGTINKSEALINLILCTCFESVDDKCSFCVVIDSASVHMCIGWLFLLLLFKKNFHVLCGIENLQK